MSRRADSLLVDGKIYDHLSEALELGTLSEVLWMLGVVLEDREAPLTHTMAVKRARDGVDHDVISGLGGGSKCTK